ncbi:Holliday junction resolvase [archaeon]|jgi:holliday junction resolvase Hjr|nr:Holliday junction resolvase [archaeon]MBT3450973.1 Holliday junction resolvase [archaeon]MBT6868607.1 Holliday junction resolvase [archaeon]MBT7193139.1 Holliday junction resolvase [archaeon]MBT7381119.1 Holliday junction resolvase [archaeon]
MINRKAKGSNAERELIKLLHENNWSAVRIAGSGSSKYPSPDVLAGNGYRRIAIECKTTKDKKKYLSRDEISQLKIFANNFGAEAWIALKFPGKEWIFFMIEDLEEKENSYLASLELANIKGLNLQEILKN